MAMRADTRSQTIGICLTHDELAIIREVAHVTRTSNSAWLAARIAEAMSSKLAWDRALADVDTLRQRGIETKDRPARASAMVTVETHTKLRVNAERYHLTSHAIAQATAVLSAERALAARSPFADETRPVAPQVAGAIRTLSSMRRKASEAEGDLYLDAGRALRARIIPMTNVGHGARKEAERQLMKLPHDLRDHVHMVAGWLDIPPLAVYVAACRKAERQANALPDVPSPKTI